MAIDFPELRTDLLQSGLPVRFRAPGSSMHPTIRDGEVVTVIPMLARQIRRGDVLLYQAERGLTAHRVIRRFPGPEIAFRVRGDAPGSEDEHVVTTQVLGKVESVERAGHETQVDGFFRCSVVALACFVDRLRIGLGKRLRQQGARSKRQSCESPKNSGEV